MKKIRLAITGGIGSGKSTALELLQQMGYPTFSCDTIYKEILDSKEYIERLHAVFPEAFKEGALDKACLSAIVFQNKERRNVLNSIAHPLIMNRLFKEMDKAESSLAVAEVPLLFEIDAEKDFDCVFVITRKKDARLNAVKNRDGISAEEIKRRMDSQIDFSTNKGEAKLRAKNVFLIENNSSKEELRENLKKTLTKIIQS